MPEKELNPHTRTSESSDDKSQSDNRSFGVGVNQGVIESYIHPNKKIGALVELDCETDFAARTEDFQKLAHELCLQIAAMNPKKTSLMKQPWIKDESRTIKELIDEYIAKLGENIVVKRFIRYEI